MPDKEHVALTHCYYCGEADKILLASKYQQTKNGMEPVKDLAPFNGKVIDMEPCRKCQDWMKQGIILIGIDDEKSEPNWNKAPEDKNPNWMPDPYRSGAFAVMKEEAFTRLFGGNEIFVDHAIKHRFMFVEHEVMVRTGIVKEEGHE